MAAGTLTRQDIPTEPQASSAWIAPNGDFYYVRPCNHNYVAEELLGSNDWSLLASGWVQLSAQDVFTPRRARGPAVTQAQIDTLWAVVDAYMTDPRWNARTMGEELANEVRDISAGMQ